MNLFSSNVALEELVRYSLRASPFTNPFWHVFISRMDWSLNRLLLTVHNCIQKCSFSSWNFSCKFDCRVMWVCLFDELVYTRFLMWLRVGLAAPSLIWHWRDVLICFAREKYISSAFALRNLCNLARIGVVFYFSLLWRLV